MSRGVSGCLCVQGVSAWGCTPSAVDPPMPWLPDVRDDKSLTRSTVSQEKSKRHRNHAWLGRHFLVVLVSLGVIVAKYQQ